ncbi:hypothetical protein QUF74_02220 [Candidatus Halobeggiatoa sp. HSG11]|nr:hypothetical protein [Candidatus Halobeggiatoa sp. HSG11]
MDKESQNVIITDVKMPFISMVGFMIKWSLASIPATIIFTLVVVGLWFGAGFLIDMFGLQDMFSFTQ